MFSAQHVERPSFEKRLFSPVPPISCRATRHNHRHLVITPTYSRSPKPPKKKHRHVRRGEPLPTGGLHVPPAQVGRGEHEVSPCQQGQQLRRATSALRLRSRGVEAEEESGFHRAKGVPAGEEEKDPNHQVVNLGTRPVTRKHLLQSPGTLVVKLL